MRYLTHMPIEVGNFVALFNEGELLDEFEERIFPILTSKKTFSFGRGGEDKNFAFHNFKFAQDVKGEWYFCGRLIRNMKLQSDQEHDLKTWELKKRKRSMNDSPSTFFILRMIDHKVIIMKETSRAPGLSMIESFLKRSFKLHRQELKENALIAYRKRLKKKRLKAEEKIVFNESFNQVYPLVHFRITPISSFKAVKDSFRKFRELHSLSVTLHHTNDEDPKFRSNLIKQLRDTKNEMGRGKTATVKASVSNKELGLDINQAESVAEDVALSKGNASFSASGEDENGSEITLKDNELSIKDTVEVAIARNENLEISEGTKKLEQHAGPPDPSTVEKKNEILQILIQKLLQSLN